MKKFIVIVFALLVFQKWDSINAYVSPPPDYSSLHGGKVVLYATDWCGYCKKMREFLAEKNISYHEYDIEKSSEGRKQYNSLGGSGVPVVVVNSNVVHGYVPQQVLEYLKQ